MKQILLLSLAVVLSFLGCQPAEAPREEAESQEPVTEEAPVAEADRGTAEVTLGGAQISINYGRPELKGREMLAMLEDGQVWRLGMNEAATFETSADLAFGDVVLKAGKYSIWAKKISAEQWHLIFNSEVGIWGTERRPENDVAEIPLARGDIGQSVERFTIELVAVGGNSGEMVMRWATLQLTATFFVS